MPSPRKRDQESESPKKKHKTLFKEPINAIICDIEGTTTPISFVHDILFPYVLDNLKDFLEQNWKSKECQKHVKALHELSLQDIKDDIKGAVKITIEDKDKSIESIVKSIKWQMSIDRKIGPLKALQGYMWKSGYEAGTLLGVVYQDVIDQFNQWKKHEKKIYIYSSGSIAAQKLLFGYSDKGDLLHYFSGHFDTSIGSKLECESYTAIAKEIDVKPTEILFLTDNIKENVAAKKAGFQTLNINRPGNAVIDDLNGFDQINDFKPISFE